jgi:hypothetical protein
MYQVYPRYIPVILFQEKGIYLGYSWYILSKSAISKLGLYLVFTRFMPAHLKLCDPSYSISAIGMQRHTGFGLQGCLMFITARAILTGHLSARAETCAPLPSQPPLPSSQPSPSAAAAATTPKTAAAATVCVVTAAVVTAATATVGVAATAGVSVAAGVGVAATCARAGGGGQTDRTKTTAWQGGERLRQRCSKSRPFHETLQRRAAPRTE